MNTHFNFVANKGMVLVAGVLAALTGSEAYAGGFFTAAPVAVTAPVVTAGAPYGYSAYAPVYRPVTTYPVSNAAYYSSSCPNGQCYGTGFPNRSPAGYQTSPIGGRISNPVYYSVPSGISYPAGGALPVGGFKNSGSSSVVNSPSTGGNSPFYP